MYIKWQNFEVSFTAEVTRAEMLCLKEGSSLQPMRQGRIPTVELQELGGDWGSIGEGSGSNHGEINQTIAGDL